MSERKAVIAQQFIEAIPHAKALGMSITNISDGNAQMEMDYDKRFVGDPETGVVSGGVISALMDTCCGAAVVAHPEVTGSTATLDLRIDYMRAAKPGERIVAQAEVYHLTRTVAFVRAQTFDGDRENPVATATGAFTAEKKQ